jgi:membrane protein implicated in regulation of membrane protease activity
MNKILENMNDPSWWFTALFVAIIASLFAAYFKDFLNIVLVRVSGRYRRWRNMREAKNQAWVEATANDPTLLLISLLYVILNFMGLIFLIFIFMFYPIWTELMIASPKFASWMFSTPSMSILLAKILMVFLGVSICFFIFRLQNRTSRFKKAHKLYIQKHNGKRKQPLEKLPPTKIPR